MNVQAEFWSRLDKVRTGMIMLDERHLPMSHYAARDEQRLYFITAAGTTMEAAADQDSPCHYIICSDGESLYADIKGTLSHERSRAKLEELWNPIAAAWFDGEMTDPDVRLLKLEIETAEVWISKGNPLAFLYQVAKGNLSDEQPDIGERVTLEFRPN